MDTNKEARLLALLDEVLELAPGERETWLGDRCGDDEALKARALALLRAGNAPWMHTGAARFLGRDEELPDRIGAYRITGLIGQGGMGAVYRGERAAGDFDHIAAIKLIRPGALSDELIGRFRRERQTLARLSHPGIARLFDGGETEHGQPYLVMEYVEGRPLGSWLAEQTPPREARLAIFLKICAAVAHAHQNLVIHRDLTPANVLIDMAGEPRLIDFGIARPVDAEDGDGAAQTETPGFAAPERLAGAPATTLADIYALGVLLDLLLGEGAGTDLRAIIARASAVDPDARYPTVDALIDDLERYRDGRAVHARRGGAAYRMGRFISRYRLPVAAAAVALLVLIGALVATLIANRRAEIARAEAEQRFAQTRAIANTLLFPAFDEVRKARGGTSAQVLLARTGLAYLDALSAVRNAPFDVRLEVGRGYVRLAQVIGGGEGAQLGKLADGNKLLARADAILSEARRERPGDADALRAFAALRLEQAGVNLAGNNAPEMALAQAQEAAKLLAPRRTQDKESARLYAMALAGEADALGWANRYDAGRVANLHAESFIAGLPADWQRDPRMMALRAANLRQLGEAHHKLKDKAAAQRVLDEAVAVNRALLARLPGDPEAVNKLIRTLWYRAVVHRTNYRDALAADSIGEALALARAETARDPEDANALRLFALVGEVQAQVLGDAKRFADSEAMGDEVIAAHKRLVSLAGDPAGARRSMAQALRTTGGNFYNAGDYAKACARWRAALDIFEDARRRGVLLERDRTNSMAEMQDFIGRGCNPPHAGLGDEL
ncbi:MAG: serine/threonine protein kinase [Proteobacteria bacterium]|nr:serine/threonine protein kinase [Pseudomonadota bacterium]